MPREIRAQELLALKEIAELLNTTNDLNQMLNDVLVKLLAITGLSTGWIYLKDETHDIVCTADHNLPPALASRDKAAMCAAGCWCVEQFRENELHRAVNIVECTRITHAASHDLGCTAGITHHATVPLHAGSDRFGLLNVAQAGKDHFSKDELALLEAIALQIGTAIKRARLFYEQERHAHHYALLDTFTQQINAIQSLDDLPLNAVTQLSDIFGWPFVALFLHEQNTLSLRALHVKGQSSKEWRSIAPNCSGAAGAALSGNRLVRASLSEDMIHELSPGILPPHASAAIPLRIRNRAQGVLLLGSDVPHHFESYQEEFLYSLADHISLVIENTRVYEQRRELTRIEERNRVARDLHDSVLQKIFSLSFLAKGAQHVLADQAPVVRESLYEIQRLSQEALKEMRTLIWQLRPTGLEHGVIAALQQYAASLGLKLLTESEERRALPRDVEETLWRIGQEALNNVKKHSGTNEAAARLHVTDTIAQLDIRDEGRGFAVEMRRGPMSMGLLSMRERAELLGGELLVESGIGRPTVVTVRIPFDTEARLPGKGDL